MLHAECGLKKSHGATSGGISSPSRDLKFIGKRILIERLNEKCPMKRGEAAEALGILKSRTAIVPLREMIIRTVDNGAYDTYNDILEFCDANAISAAAIALGRIGKRQIELSERGKIKPEKAFADCRLIAETLIYTLETVDDYFCLAARCGKSMTKVGRFLEESDWARITKLIAKGPENQAYGAALVAGELKFGGAEAQLLALQKKGGSMDKQLMVTVDWALNRLNGTEQRSVWEFNPYIEWINRCDMKRE